MGSRHASRAQHTDHFGILPCHVLDANGAVGTTRMCWSTPSLMKASGSPVSTDVKKISPQKRPGRMQYFSCVIAPL
jgi:hypothetical protein